MINTKLRPLMLVLLAGLTVAGAVHADSGDEILKRRQQYTDAMEKDMRGDGAFGRTRKELDVRGCQQEMHYYTSRGYLPSYSCLVLYAQDKANGHFAAFVMPTADDYNAWVTEHRALEKTYPKRQASKSARDNSVTLASGPYDTHHRKLFAAHAKLNPFDGVTISRQTSAAEREAARAEVAKLTPMLDLLKGQVWREGASPTPDVQALQALRTDPALKRVVLGKPDAPVTVTLFADAGGLRSVAAIAEYSALANAGKIRLELIPFALSALSVEQNAALLVSSAPTEAIEAAIQGALSTLRNPDAPSTVAPASDAAAQSAIEQSRALKQDAKLTYAPVAFVSKPGSPLIVLDKLAAVDVTAPGTGEIAFAPKPLNDVLDPLGAPLLDKELSPAGRALLEALDANRKLARPQTATTRLLDLVTGKEAPRQIEAPEPTPTYVPTEAERDMRNFGRQFYR